MFNNLFSFLRRRGKWAKDLSENENIPFKTKKHDIKHSNFKLLRYSDFEAHKTIYLLVKTTSSKHNIDHKYHCFYKTIRIRIITIIIIDATIQLQKSKKCIPSPPPPLSALVRQNAWRLLHFKPKTNTKWTQLSLQTIVEIYLGWSYSLLTNPGEATNRSILYINHRWTVCLVELVESWYVENIWLTEHNFQLKLVLWPWKMNILFSTFSYFSHIKKVRSGFHSKFPTFPVSTYSTKQPLIVLHQTINPTLHPLIPPQRKISSNIIATYSGTELCITKILRNLTFFLYPPSF